MPSCVVKRCTNYEKKFTKKHGISYHRFPADPERNAVWTRILRIQRKEANFNSNKYTRICSMHFSPKDFRLSEGGLRKLKKTAIPRLLVTKNLRDNNGFSSDDSDGIDEPILSKGLREIGESNLGISEDNAGATINEDDRIKKPTLVKLPSSKTNVKKQKKLLKNNKSEGKVTKTTRQDIADIKIDYDNIDKFGEQISFLLKRIPRKLCRELQDNIVTLVKTAMKYSVKKAETNVIPNITITSSVSKSITRPNDIPLSRILLPQTQSDYPQDNGIEEIIIKVEPGVIDDKRTVVEDYAQTQITESFKTTQQKHYVSSVEVPKPMSTAIDFVGSTKVVKMEESDHEADGPNIKEAFNSIFPDNSNTCIKIEIEETDMIEEANRKMYYDNNG